MLEKLLRWLGIKLLVRCCISRSPEWQESRKVYNVVNRGAIQMRLIGQKPGTSYSVPGRKVFVLIGECIHYMVGRTVLRGPGSLFSTGIMHVKPGPGVSWCWYLQIGL
jgi:hypothetical protein